MGCGHPTRYASVAVLGVYIFVRLWTDIVNVTASQQCKRAVTKLYRHVVENTWRPNNIKTVNTVYGTSYVYPLCPVCTHTHTQLGLEWVCNYNNRVPQKSVEYDEKNVANYNRQRWRGRSVPLPPPHQLYTTDEKMSTVPFNHPASNHLVIIPLQRLAEAEGRVEGEQQREGKRDSMWIEQEMERWRGKTGGDRRGVSNSLPLVAEACMSLTGDNKPRW